MAKAEGYINEYEAALKDYNRLVDEYNASIDRFSGSLYESGTFQNARGQLPGRGIADNFYAYQYPDGFVGRRPENIYQGEIVDQRTNRGGSIVSVRDPQTGRVYENLNSANNGGVQDGNKIILPDGRILTFTPEPGNFSATTPSFDMERYKSLLTEDIKTGQDKLVAEMQAEQQAIRDALAKTQAEEKAKFDSQRVEMERTQAVFAAEAAAAEQQARKNLEQAQSDAAAAATERETKTKQFRDETDAMQRDIGARRAGYVRARRMRSRSLLSGA